MQTLAAEIYIHTFSSAEYFLCVLLALVEMCICISVAFMC